MNARDKVRAKLKAELAELRRAEQDDAARRLAKARENKDFADAERALAKANIALASARARGESTSKLETGLKKAQTAYDSALKRLGADVSVHYRCDKCRDIGFDKDGEPCDCVKAQFIDMLKAECGAENIPPFTFADDRSASLDCSQKEELGWLYKRFRQFCDGFDKTSVKVIFLCGKPGIGKSSLAYAAANELLSRGRSVCCLTAFEFNNAMLKYHTSPLAARAAIMEPVTDSDLLIIDDLGTAAQRHLRIPLQRRRLAHLARQKDDRDVQSHARGVDGALRREDDLAYAQQELRQGVSAQRRQSPPARVDRAAPPARARHRIFPRFCRFALASLALLPSL